MTTKLAVNDELISEAVKIGNHKTKQDAVTVALQEYIRSKRRLGILSLVGQIDYEPGYDYKVDRRRGSKRVGRGQ